MIRSVVPHALVNVGWYLLRLAWFAAPWSLVACAVAWVWLRFRTIGTFPAPFDETTERGLVWALILTAVFIDGAEPRARARRAVHLPDLLRDRSGGRRGRDRTVGERPQSGRAERTGMPGLPIAVWMVMFLLSLGSKVLR